MVQETDNHDVIAAAYWRTAWPEPIRLMMETHAELDPAVANMRNSADQIGGALLDTLEPASMGEGALASVLAAIDEDERDDRAHMAAASSANDMLNEFMALPDPARTIGLEAFAAGGWKFAGRGVHRMELAREGDIKAELFRIEPGRGVPAHTHRGDEHTLVLTGAFHDGRRRYERGDLCVAGPDTDHKPIAEEGEICYALAVTNAPLAFKGMLGVMQRVFASH